MTYSLLALCPRTGRMGLGTSQESYVRHPHKVLPKKPDPMTANHKPAGSKPSGRR